MGDKSLADYDLQIINDFIQRGQNASNTTEKGKALEDLVSYIFSNVRGLEIYETNVTNFYRTEEVDIALWNEQNEDVLRSLPNIIFIECKNLNSRVVTNDVAYFITKLRNRGLTFGILITSLGITGSEHNSTAAHFEISLALKDGIKLIIITTNDIINLSNTDNLIKLIKRKICSLYVTGSIEL